MNTITKLASLLLIPLIGLGGHAIAKAGTVPPCANGSLTLSVTRHGAAAGTAHYWLHLRNTTTAACTLDGYPDVRLRAHGRQLGEAAARDRTSSPALVILLPGAAGRSDLGVTEAGNYPRALCKPAESRWARVYAPGLTEPLHASLRVAACTRKVPVGSQLSTGPEALGYHGTAP
jgi:Protein of unknown function (DUF4232)